MNKFFKILLAAHLPILMSSFFYLCDAQPMQSLDSTSIEPENNIESAELFPLLKSHGSIFNTRNESYNIHKSEIEKLNYISVLEVINQKTTSQPFFSNAFGKRDKLGLNGYYHNATSINGVQQFGAGNSAFSFWTRSADANENIEIFEGAEAIPFANNTGGTLINFQEIAYNTSTPFIRLWGSDVNDDLLSFDGTWSQNFAPNWNFYGGYRSLAGNSRYDNTDVRSRNLRIGFRKTIDSNSQISFSYLHSNNLVGSNSGIDPLNSLDINGDFTDSPVNSIVNFESLNRRNKSHDFIANYTHFSDSTKKQALSVSAYSNYTINHEDFGNLFFNVGSGIETYSNYKLGSNISFEKHINNIFLKTNASIDFIGFENNYSFNKISYLNNSIGVYSALLNYNFKPYFSFKYSNYISNNLLDFGGGIEFKIKGLPFKLDYSLNNVAPNLYQNTAEVEKHSLILLKTEFNISNAKLEINLWNRIITDQIIYGIINTSDKLAGFKYLQNQNLTISGASVNLQFKASENLIFNTDNIYVDLTLITNPAVQGRSPFPMIYSEIETYINIPRGKSEANIGFNWKLASRMNGYGYNDFYDSYYVNPYQSIEPMFDNIEIFARFRLNHAWLKVSFCNPLGTDIYYLAHHRAFNQFFKMSFNWTIR
ncbi:hypothetical protein OAQ99_02520 [Candidatus Kapabacteria bacterium]|nr:hypothetical protein [Candidatus Kapabacteria bacterium]